MSATSGSAAHERPTARHRAASFDVERIHGPFRADIAQLAHAIRRLLDSGTEVRARPLNPRRPRSLSPTCISGDFERVM